MSLHFRRTLAILLMASLALALWLTALPREHGEVVIDPSPPSSVEVLSGRP